MGHVTVVGGCRAKAPSTGILASTLPVGSTVKLMEGGTAVEYLVVNQGIPSNSNLYDSSCDGTWLLRKDCHSKRQWNTSDVNIYETSAINTWLNADFFHSFGNVEQAAIKQVKIPYRKNGGMGGTNQSGANGLGVKAFLLGGYEIGWTTSFQGSVPVDGAGLSYFEVGNTQSAVDKRKAYLNGSAAYWWPRSPSTYNNTQALLIADNGGFMTMETSTLRSIRPLWFFPAMHYLIRLPCS